MSQADLDDLHEADDELMRASYPNKRIVRHDGDGEEVVLTTQADIAAWKGISESHFHSKKRGGWKFKRGVPYEDKSDDTVSGDAARTMYELQQGHIESLIRRIAELEAELEELRRNQP